jgi:ATP-dependent DNA helicase PIF1
MELAQAYASLNVDQRRAFDAVMEGQNLFITGPGGTGKSFLIRALVGAMPTDRQTAVVALTGCAALLLDCGAKTLHSWAGIGLGKDPVDTLVASIKKKTWKPCLRNWKKTKTLIIDEVSMMQPDLFEKLDQIGRRIRDVDAPFGGMQIVLFGDFYQLPPIAVGPTKFVFESSIWPEVIKATIQLRVIVRQPDPAFQQLLNAARCGELKDEHVAVLETRRNLPWRDQEIRPTLLFSRRREVEQINAANLEALVGEAQTYNVGTKRERGAVAAPSAEVLANHDKDAPYDVALTLKVGAQVMLNYNVDVESGLVNGSRGVVRRFIDMDGEMVPIVRFMNGTDVAIERAKWELDNYKGVCRTQIPLRLAYACTIHRAQGATLDCAMIDIGANVFEFGQAYVALSRVKSLDSLYVWALDPAAVKAHPGVRAFYAGLEDA